MVSQLAFKLNIVFAIEFKSFIYNRWLIFLSIIYSYPFLLSLLVKDTRAMQKIRGGNKLSLKMSQLISKVFVISFHLSGITKQSYSTPSCCASVSLKFQKFCSNPRYTPQLQVINSRQLSWLILIDDVLLFVYPINIK